MIEIFKPEDFDDMISGYGPECSALASHVANAKFREWLEKQPITYYPTLEGDWTNPGAGINPTYPWERIARLVCVEGME